MSLLLNYTTSTARKALCFGLGLVISAVMDGPWIRMCFLTLTTVFLQEVAALNLRNELLGKCVQVQDVEGNEKLILDECKPGSVLQEWQWNPKTRSLRNPKTDKCLTAHKIQDQGTVGLLACRAEDNETQVWSCSKKGHLTLYGKGFHLSVRYDSSDIFLSTERGKSTKWKTLNERMVCEEPQKEPEKMEPKIIAKIRMWQPRVNLELDAPKPTEPLHFTTALPHSNSSTDLGEPGIFVYGMEWKVTMLVLSSLALITGMVILILHIYQNSRGKTVVVLKSYTSNNEGSQPGSPVSCEKAPLTKHPMKPPRSPPIQRGEILIEWKDGTVTPLFDAYQTS